MRHITPRWLPRKLRTVTFCAIGASAVVLSAYFATASSATSMTAGSAIPASAAHQLKAAMYQMARASGDARPTSVQAVLTTRAKALQLATPGETVPGSTGQTVYLVVMKGHFTLREVSLPRGAHAPRGHYLSETLNPTTLQPMDIGLRNQASPIPLHSLGPVSNLTRR
jgi:hypothetical protein